VNWLHSWGRHHTAGLEIGDECVRNAERTGLLRRLHGITCGVRVKPPTAGAAWRMRILVQCVMT
jgi:hypothetical protein